MARNPPVIHQCVWKEEDLLELLKVINAGNDIEWLVVVEVALADVGPCPPRVLLCRPCLVALHFENLIIEN